MYTSLTAGVVEAFKCMRMGQEEDETYLALGALLACSHAHACTYVDTHMICICVCVAPDLSIQCYFDSRHYVLLFVCALPMGLVYVLGTPVLSFLLLLRNKDKVQTIIQVITEKDQHHFERVQAAQVRINAWCISRCRYRTRSIGL